jgi:3-isopropylmalate/(R)-2-methylmalate dehydratase large subunit
MCNMAIEAGGKSGIVQPDATTLAWVDQRAWRPYEALLGDADAEYAEVYDIDCSVLEPVVSFPHLPENTRPISQVGDIPIDQVIIGACTNGWLEDLRRAAQVLKGRKVAKYVRCIVLPGSYAIYLEAIKEGLIETFIEAGCLGGHLGILAAGERAVATTNRNFIGRMGHPESEVYLASPYVAAASAVAGKIAGPDDL